MFTFLLVIHAIVAASLVTVILMQRSEGGGLGMGGSPSGLMSARGAADFLTRMTSILGATFIGFSILLAVLASTRHSTATIDTSLAKRAQPAVTQPSVTQPVPAEPVAPFSNTAAGASGVAPPDNGAVPLAR